MTKPTLEIFDFATTEQAEKFASSIPAMVSHTYRDALTNTVRVFVDRVKFGKEFKSIETDELTRMGDNIG